MAAPRLQGSCQTAKVTSLSQYEVKLKAYEEKAELKILMVPPKRLTPEEQSRRGGRLSETNLRRCSRRGDCNKSGSGSSANWMSKMQTCTYATWAKELHKERLPSSGQK
jgi:hypothetical protein